MSSWSPPPRDRAPRREQSRRDDVRRLGPETTLCISLASRPSVFGMTIHNAAYEALGLDFLYKACRVTEIGEGMRAVRALGIRGCSLSMPYKQAALPFLDAIDPAAAAIGAVNTVVNDAGVLTGFNTDRAGALVALDAVGVRPTDAALVLGGGGVARAIVHALHERGVTRIMLATRSTDRATEWSRPDPQRPAVELLPWEERDRVACDLLINATPVGMPPEREAMPVTAETVRRVRAVFDVVVRGDDSPLIACARAAGRQVATGVQMTLHQAAEQFRLYTGVDAPLAVMESALRPLLVTSAAR